MRQKLILLSLVLAWVGPSLVLGQVPNGAAPEPTFELWEFGTMPRPAFKQVLLSDPAVQNELKLTPEQKKAVEARLTLPVEKLLEPLEPRQRQRLDQIQLQSQGPAAFFPDPWQRLAEEGPAIVQRLKLSDDQIRQVREIARRGDRPITEAATVPVGLDSKNGPPTRESIVNLVKTPEFQATKQKTRQAARKVWSEVIQQIEQVLTESQRAAYHELLGPPFDLWSIRFGEDESEVDAGLVASAFNTGGGQRPDPGFNTKVENPAYTTRHPRVLFDEAHHNFHTTTGRYKPFAELLASDGYQVIPNQEKLTKEQLGKAEILVIANALGAEGMGQTGASDSAFSEAECDAIQDWVRQGGSLLLITDHAPFGSAAESLSRRFGVDMSKGFTSDPANSEGGATRLVFTRKNQLLGDHAITRGRNAAEQIGRIMTFTGQSLKGPAGSVTLLKLGETAMDSTEDDKAETAAGRAQGLAFGFGKGRVVVMGEAAELSAQLIGIEPMGMNVPGIDNRQFALNILHWLSGLLEPPSPSAK